VKKPSLISETKITGQLKESCITYVIVPWWCQKIAGPSSAKEPKNTCPGWAKRLNDAIVPLYAPKR